MEPDNPFTPDVMQKLGDAARELGVTIAVVGESSVTTIIPFLSPETGVPVDESRFVAGPAISSVYANPADAPPPAPGTGEQTGRRILLVDSGLSGGGFGRSMLRLSAGLALAAATMTAQAAVASPRKKAASLFARVPHMAAPGMEKQDLQRMQRQHAQKANARSRYRPR